MAASEDAKKLGALQARLGPRFLVVKPCRDRVLHEGILFQAEGAGPITANVREAVVTNDALLIVKQESRSQLSLAEVPLLGAFVRDTLAAQLDAATAAPAWGFELISPAVGRSIQFAASDEEAKKAWVAHLAAAIGELLPPSQRAAAGWLHQYVVTGTLWHAAISGSEALTRALCQLTPSARARGVSEVPFDAKRFPELDIDAADDDGCSALHYAARSGHVGVTRALLAAGARLDVGDNDFDTPLHAAIAVGTEGSLAVASLLIVSEAPADARNLLDQTPLQLAVRAIGASAGVPGCDGGSAASAASSTAAAAAVQGSVLTKIVELLLSHGADPRARDAEGLEPLHYAAAWPAVTPLLAGPLTMAGADPNAPVRLDDAAALAAAAPQSPSGSSSRPLNGFGRPSGELYAPLHLACGVGAAWCAATAAAAATSPSAGGGGGAAAALRAAEVAALRAGQGGGALVSAGAVSALLGQGAQPNARLLGSGETPLHLLLRLLGRLRAAAAAAAPSPSSPAAAAAAAAFAVQLAGQVAEVATAAQRLVGAGARLDVADAAGVLALQLADEASLRPYLEPAAAAYAARAVPASAPSLVGALERTSRRWVAGSAAAVAAGGSSRLHALCPAHACRLGHTVHDSKWAADGASEGCLVCGAGFTLFSRKHHCRHCGVLVCGACSGKKFPLVSAVAGAASDDGSGSPSFGLRPAAAGVAPAAAAPPPALERVCDACFNRLSGAVAHAALKASEWEREKAVALAAARNFTRDRDADAAEAAAKAALLAGGRSPGGAAAAAGGRQTSGGGGAVSQARQQQSELKNTLSEVNEKLALRGEKLAHIADRSRDMADSAHGFAAAAQRLKEQSKGGWFGL